MRSERRRRFRGTLFVTRFEEHEHLRVAVTRLPERGIPDGPAFVLVHGIGVSSRYFRPLAARLTDDGTVHLVDLPGYGAAPDPKRPVSLDDHADAVASFIRTLPAPEVVVVGHSMGAQVVVSLAVNAIVFSDYVFRAGPAYTIRQLPLVLEDALEDRVADARVPMIVVRGARLRRNLGGGGSMSEQRPQPSFGRTAVAVARDFPNAMRFRARSARAWPVPEHYAQGHKRPVVIAPGVFETWHYLRLVADALNDAGHPVFTVPGLGFNHRPIPESAGIVWRRILELDLHDVAIVAHSKGGLIGKHLLAHDDVEGRVERVVAIATPFAGSRMAYYTVGKAVREFRPDNPVIASLLTVEDVDSRIVSIAPRWDPHIPDGSTVPGGRNVTIPVVGHFRILLDPRLPPVVVEEVERELGT